MRLDYNTVKFKVKEASVDRRQLAVDLCARIVAGLGSGGVSARSLHPKQLSECEGVIYGISREWTLSVILNVFEQRPDQRPPEGKLRLFGSDRFVLSRLLSSRRRLTPAEGCALLDQSLRSESRIGEIEWANEERS